MPYKNFMTEVLSAHAEQKLDTQNYAQLFPKNKDLPTLLFLADKIRTALEPVSAPASFTERLHQDLLTTAHQKYHQNEQTPSHNLNAPLFISAIISATIVLGSILLFVRKQNLKQKAMA